MSYLAVVLVGAAFSASPADIQLPQPPVVPSPAPDPGAVLTLGTDQLYVAQSDAEFVVRDHPRGLVKVTYEKGPIRVRARFAGGFATETKTFDGPYVAFVEAAGKGRVELDFIPLNLKAEKDIRMAVVDVDGNTAPIPPPNPKPPEPPKPVDPLTKALSDAYAGVAEPDKRERSKAFAAVMREAADWSKVEATNLALMNRVANRVKEKCGDSLQPVRKAVTAHLVTIFPADVVALTPEWKTKFAAEFNKVAAILEGLAP